MYFEIAGNIIHTCSFIQYIAVYEGTKLILSYKFLNDNERCKILI